MRHRFVSDVVKELMGPRRGATETFVDLDEPRNEYSTGQLFPADAVQERDPDAENSVGEEAGGGDEDADDGAGSAVNQALIDAGQNFRRVPSSMGISFVVSRQPSGGDISVCVTWGRYLHQEGTGWVRVPSHWILNLDQDEIENNPNNDPESEDGSLRLSCRVSSLRDGRFKISIYLSSLVRNESGGRPQNEDIIFQPEIRVNLRDSATLRELGDMSFTSDDPEWRVSTRQYDRLAVFARGHLCGAYWREIDPQRPLPGRDTLEVDTPFLWIDGRHFLAENPRIQEFLVPLLRTDFIPMYPAPAAGASSEIRAEFIADQISNCSNFDDLRSRIQPLIDAYEQWVRGLRVDSEHRETDEEIIRRHREAVDRIRRGLEFLRNDESARLAFLFMNKAMARQYAWGRSGDDRTMRWRPFQLAFILLSMESTVNGESAERNICDTIWFPTGGGKTEAYLGLAAFTMAYRRIVSAQDGDGSRRGDGTAVISRYTLRLLTIQQFRRALKMIMACETLRCESVQANGAGWLPVGWGRLPGLVWGHTPFSIGLWVGGAVTPNQMKGAGYRDFSPGALNLLERPSQRDQADPAQILNCPCCNTVLSFPIDEIPAGTLTLKLHVSGRPNSDQAALTAASSAKFRLESVNYQAHMSGRTGYSRIDLRLNSSVSASELNRWWMDTAEAALGLRLNSFGVSRPGYVPILGGRRGQVTDYEIRCPDPDCELNRVMLQEKLPNPDGEWDFVEGHPLFRMPNDSTSTRGLRIPALTVDEKILGHPPSMLISTVDKFARLAFTNEAASLFGRIRTFDFGVDRKFSQEEASRTRVEMESFSPPALIIQDELHLLDGPLGSTFGFFEAAVDYLSESPKYIASSATIRNSAEQVSCLMGRQSRVFPPVNPDISEGFFLNAHEIHPLNESGTGRMFLGFAFPGRAPQTPMLRLWGRLLQTAQDLHDQIQAMPDGQEKTRLRDQLDHYWTLIGYFNAVRELAQGETLIRQDIPQFLDKLHRNNPTATRRPDLGEGFRNLSSQTSSSELPGILAKMERGLEQGDALSAVASTSMFGTGVDVSRLSLMIVHGQPKSASQYIQAVGRIGRRRAGLAAIFFRVSKPRDLNHYEYFTGYHRKLPVAVEPISVKPMAPKTIEKSVGPLLAVLLRNWARENPAPPNGIDLNEGAALIEDISPEMIEALTGVFREKWHAQPPTRRSRDPERFENFVRSQIERWQEYARLEREAGRTLGYSGGQVPLLGKDDGSASVYRNVSQSLREVEPTIQINTGRD